MSELEKASMELGKIVYEEAAKAASAGGAAPGATPDGAAAGATGGKKDDVIDAEFKVKE